MDKRMNVLRQRVLMKRLINHPGFPIIVAPIILFSTLLFTGTSLFWGTPSTQIVP